MDQMDIEGDKDDFDMKEDDLKTLQEKVTIINKNTVGAYTPQYLDLLERVPCELCLPPAPAVKL